jgi:hypothetical protein
MNVDQDAVKDARAGQQQCATSEADKSGRVRDKERASVDIRKTEVPPAYRARAADAAGVRPWEKRGWHLADVHAEAAPTLPSRWRIPCRWCAGPSLELLESPRMPRSRLRHPRETVFVRRRREWACRCAVLQGIAPRLIRLETITDNDVVAGAAWRQSCRGLRNPSCLVSHDAVAASRCQLPPSAAPYPRMERR